MSPWTFLLPTLFNFAVLIFIVVIWIIFVRNFLREMRKGKQRTQNQWTQQTRTQQSRQIAKEPSVSSPSRRNAQRGTRTNARSQQRKRSTSWQSTSAKTDGQSIRLRELMKYKPADLYRLLKDHLPEEYKEEIQSIFNSPNAEVELIKFIRRPDVWPTVQKSLAEISSGSSRRQTASRPMGSQKTPQAVVEKPSADEEYIDLDWLDREDAQLQSEYDSVVHEFDYFMEDISGKDLTESIQTASSSSRFNKTRLDKEISDKKWLKEAVIATVILEKPDF